MSDKPYAYESFFEGDIVAALEEQAHATKALAEEQRTANLIAVRNELLERGRLKPSGPTNEQFDLLVKLDVQIYTRLGLN